MFFVFPVETAASLLELADRFFMTMVTRLVEPVLIRDETMRTRQKLALADKYSLAELTDHCLLSLKSATETKKIIDTPHFEEMSEKLKSKLYKK